MYIYTPVRFTADLSQFIQARLPVASIVWHLSEPFQNGLSWAAEGGDSRSTLDIAFARMSPLPTSTKK